MSNKDNSSNKKEVIKRKRKVNKNHILIGSFILLAGFLAWLHLRVSFPVDAGVIITVLALSIMFNVLILGISLGTGTGIAIVKRFRQKFMYNTGKYVNTLFISKNGTLKECFTKIDHETGKFKLPDQKHYVRNPRLLFNYNRIPTYVHREDNPDPLNVWQDNLATDISCAEIDTVMNSQGAFDLKEWLDKNKAIIFFALIMMTGACAAAAYFGYSGWAMMRDGTIKTTCEVASNVIKPVV